MPEGHVYILGSETGTLYTGVTSDFDNVASGNTATASKVHLRKQVRLQESPAHEQFTDIRSAISREKEIKGWTRAKKA